MESIHDIQQEIIDEFDMFSDWMEKYDYLIDLGKSLPLIDARYKTDENIIKGCQSKVPSLPRREETALDFPTQGHHRRRVQHRRTFYRRTAS